MITCVSLDRYNKGAVYQYTYNGTSWSLVGDNTFYGNTLMVIIGIRKGVRYPRMGNIGF